MKISFQGRYKSIENLNWEGIPKLAVITGKNGTGKSQLLDLIEVGITKQWKNNPNSRNALPQIENEFYRTEDLVFLRGEWALENIGAIGLSDVQQDREILYNAFNDRVLTNIQPEFYSSHKHEEFKQIRERFKTNQNQTTINDFFDDLIEKKSLFNGETLPKDEFLNLIPNNILVDIRHQATNTNIGKVFYNYRLDLIEAKSKGISEEDFIKQNSEKPWLQINQLFRDIDLPFELNNPEEVSIRDMYTPVLKNSETKEPIHFTDLSSGEKVLVSLVFWLFNSYDQGLFPKLLLLDEPDAHLHPSMTKQFIHILKNVLCAKYDVRVILTTHSPSTVALAPEEAIYIMTKGGARIEKSIKDGALGILTSGVPSFSVNYENRRQVFVESPNDVLFYEKIYQKLSNN